MNDKTFERIAEALERIATALERVAPAPPGARSPVFPPGMVAGMAAAIRPDDYGPAPKGYRCPACGHDCAHHREGGCDAVRDGVEHCPCAVPFGRIPPGDPQ